MLPPIPSTPTAQVERAGRRALALLAVAFAAQLLLLLAGEVVDHWLTPGQRYLQATPWFLLGQLVVVIVAAVGLLTLARVDPRLGVLAPLAVGGGLLAWLARASAHALVRVVPFGPHRHPGFWVMLAHILLAHAYVLLVAGTLYRAAAAPDDEPRPIVTVALALVAAVALGSGLLGLGWHLYDLVPTASLRRTAWVPEILSALSYVSAVALLLATVMIRWRSSPSGSPTCRAARSRRPAGPRD